jgi:tRNA wybutosine-synthesizing protein 2
MASENLAAVVEKPDAEGAIDSLRAEGVYDDARQVREHDGGTVELPVTDAPERTAVLDVIRQVDPDLRSPDLPALLGERGWTDAEIETAPKSWAVVGTVVLVRFPDGCPRREEVGEALLDLHGEADTVLAREGIEGDHREPDVSVVAGSGDTETTHTEHGTRYALDLATVMFSPGNQAERVRMGEVIESGERVFDMFAGIGYFTLPMARAGATVTAVERNPAAFRYLLENAVLNDVTDRVEAYRADCQEVETEADRVVMGHYDAVEYLDHALDSLRPGGVVHYHETSPESRLWERPVGRLEDAAHTRGREVEITDRRQVKSYGEGVWHVVVDARVE